jgi:hypothetical protein
MTIGVRKINSINLAGRQASEDRYQRDTCEKDYGHKKNLRSTQVHD